MYKKRMIMAVMMIMAVCFMTACAQKSDSEERKAQHSGKQEQLWLFHII